MQDRSEPEPDQTEKKLVGDQCHKKGTVADMHHRR